MCVCVCVCVCVTGVWPSNSELVYFPRPCMLVDASSFYIATGAD